MRSKPAAKPRKQHAAAADRVESGNQPAHCPASGIRNPARASIKTASTYASHVSGSLHHSGAFSLSLLRQTGLATAPGMKTLIQALADVQSAATSDN